MKNQNNDLVLVTAGDINYLWGVFLLVASIRKAGMDVPFLVGTKKFDDHANRVVTQLGGVDLLPLDGDPRSLAWLKARAMLQASAKWVAWADCDAFFTGDVTGLLRPDSEDLIHIRMRTPEERTGLIWKKAVRGDDDRVVPPKVLEVWRRDVMAVAGGALEKPRFLSTAPSNFFALSLEKHRSFLEMFDRFQMEVLPDHDIGNHVRTLENYPLFDESVLNACLAFAPDAPEVQPVYNLDKDFNRCFAHFPYHPKPWAGWTRRALAFFDEYVAVVDWAEKSGLELPGPVPRVLRPQFKRRVQALAPWTELKPKLKRRIDAAVKRFFGRERA